jgi:peptidyl-tRNA hydrolase
MAEHTAAGVDAALVAALTDMVRDTACLCCSCMLTLRSRRRHAQGFDAAAAASALRATGSRNVEAAVLWLCGADAADAGDAAGASPLHEAPPAAHHVAAAGECKAVLCVVTDLGMGVGKVAAQAAHAAVGLLRVCEAQRVPWLAAWEAGGEKTVVLGLASRADALALAAKARALALPGAPAVHAQQNAWLLCRRACIARSLASLFADTHTYT